MTICAGYPEFLLPFFTFYGGKWKISRFYPPPLYNTIYEICAGSAGYSLLHYRRNVVLIEKDPVIASVWQYLIDSSPDDILNLPMNLSPFQSVSDAPTGLDRTQATGVE